MPKWTEDQRRAIETRGGNLLVSAAAGSGKTAVLSARVGEFAEKGGKIDRLLVVTFTNAAAGEMRTRIAKELTERAAKNPENTHLRRQSLTLYKAKIQTIDSYGMDLLRRHFSAADMAPDFTVLDETELAVIQSAVLQRQIEDYYRTFPQGFAEFCALFGEETDSVTMETTLRTVAEALESIPFAEGWLEAQKENLSDPTPWREGACRVLLPTFREYLAIFREISAAAPFPKMETPTEETALLEEITAALEQNRWDEVCRRVRSHTFGKAPAAKKGYPREAFLYKEYRGRLKDFLTKSEIFHMTEDRCRADLATLQPGILFLLEAVKAFRREVLAEMKKKNAYSFGALAQGALSLAVAEYSHKTGEFVPSPIALEERRAYDEVLIDEYQDVSDLQNLFFRAVTDGNCFAVGDVKQSIYGFRGANAQNFLQKKESYTVIALNQNFRSRKGVLDFCNFVFRGLFSADLGGLEYGPDEALHAGRKEDGTAPYPPHYEATLPVWSQDLPPRERVPEPESELLLLPSKTAGGAYYSTEQNRGTAALCAKLIRDTVAEGAQIYDKNRQTLRPMRYSDVAILLRYTKDAPLYEEVFREWGIPLLTADGETFLDTPEVQGLVAFLGAINDPWDDLNLFIALTGNVFSFSPEQVATARLAGEGLPLWAGLKALKENSKAKETVKTLEKFRILAENLPMPKLIWEIYTATDYLALESAADPHARTNLMKFYSFACRYSGSEGLNGFLEFTARAKASGKVKETGAAPEGDFVRLMSIHKSKGLEFPWCILPELEKPLRNDRDKTKVDPVYGIAPKVKNPEGTAEFTTLMREFLGLRKDYTEGAEELRVLYVALTRARDRLTLICRIPEDQEKWSAWGLHSEGGRVRLNDRLQATSFRQWILDRAVAHPDGSPLQGGWSVPEEEEGRLRVSLVTEPTEIVAAKEEEIATSGLTQEELGRRFAYRYDNRLSAVPAKVSVTEIAKLPPDPDSELFLYEPPVTRPKFLEDTPQTGAEKGTALHTYCQFADFSADMEEEIARLTASGHLSEEAAKGLNRRQLGAFLESDLIQSLPLAKSYGREVRFTCAIPVAYYTGNPTDEGELLMQGAMDLLIEEEEGYTVVDFKSDNADAETLLSRYSRQVNLYAAAVRRLYDKPVKGCKIWSFVLGKALDVKEEEL